MEALKLRKAQEESHKARGKTESPVMRGTRLSAGVTNSLPNQMQKRMQTQVDLRGNGNVKSNEAPLTVKNLKTNSSSPLLVRQESEDVEDKRFFMAKNDPTKEQLLSGSKSP